MIDIVALFNHGESLHDVKKIDKYNMRDTCSGGN
jgi:hypothetical protein